MIVVLIISSNSEVAPVSREAAKELDGRVIDGQIIEEVKPALRYENGATVFEITGEYEKYVCYGGNIEVEVRNNFSPFPYEIEYVIYDAEAEESKSAMMYFTNTAKNTNTEASGGGGGSIGGLGVLGLLSLAWFRQRRKI